MFVRFYPYTPVSFTNRFIEGNFLLQNLASNVYKQIVPSPQGGGIQGGLSWECPWAEVGAFHLSLLPFQRLLDKFPGDLPPQTTSACGTSHPFFHLYYNLPLPFRYRLEGFFSDTQKTKHVLQGSAFLETYVPTVKSVSKPREMQKTWDITLETLSCR